LTPAKLAGGVGMLDPVELMMALKKLRARRDPGNQAHVTNLKESPALLAADAAEAAEILVGLVPGVRVLWAHAGMSSGPDEVARLIGVSPDLLVELALRSDVAPGGKLDPAWGDLFVRHADRFMVGTDTWVSSRWGSYVEVQNDTRIWLRQLPADVARRLATENAESLARRAP
jgi:hypothetical protein